MAVVILSKPCCAETCGRRIVPVRVKSWFLCPKLGAQEPRRTVFSFRFTPKLHRTGSRFDLYRTAMRMWDAETQRRLNCLFFPYSGAQDMLSTNVKSQGCTCLRSHGSSVQNKDRSHCSYPRKGAKHASKVCDPSSQPPTKCVYMCIYICIYSAHTYASPSVCL